MVSLAVLAVMIISLHLLTDTQDVSAEPSDDCGTNLKWRYDSESKTLEIYVPDETASATMDDYGDNDTPWREYRSEMRNLVLPTKCLTNIGKKAFLNCTGLNCSLSFPTSLTTIGNSAFQNCTGLTGGLFIPDNINKIGDSAFQNCTGLTGELIFLNKVNIGNSAFENCKGFTGDLILPEGTGLSDEAFQNCSGFNGTLRLPDGLTTVPTNIFHGCSGFKRLILNDGIVTINGGAFQNCTGLECELNLPSSVKQILDNSFRNCPGLYGPLRISNIIEKGGVGIGAGAFNGCKGFTELIFTGCTFNSIGDYAFENCTGLKGTVKFNDAVNHIGDGAFRNCTGLEHLEFEDNQSRTIDNYSFYNCTGLTGKLVIPGTRNISTYAFYGCTGLSELEITSSALQRIESYAFARCTGLTSVKLPDALDPYENAVIKEYAFYGCTGITQEIHLRNYLNQVCDNAFLGCDNILKVIIDSDVSGISAKAFPSHVFYKEDGTTKITPGDNGDFRNHVFAGSERGRMIRQASDIDAHKITYMDEDTVIKELVQGDLIPGLQFTVQSNPVSKEKHIFIGWTTDDGTTMYQPGDKITMGETDVVLKAVWVLDDIHHVTYKNNGGTGPIPIQPDVKEGDTFVIANCSAAMEGYMFMGWFCQTNGIIYLPGTGVTMGETDVVLIALWINKYTATYDIDGGSGEAPDPQTLYGGQKFALQDYSGTKEGYAFSGWIYCGILYQPGEELTMPTKDIIIAAEWTAVHHVIYDLNGGTGDVPVQDDVAEGAAFILKQCTAVKEGFYFAGWTYEGKTCRPDDEIIMGVQDITLIAFWKIGSPTHHVIYDINGGSGEAPVQGDVEEGSTFIVKHYDGTKDGYRFIGWSYDGAVYRQGAVITMEQTDMTFTAVWESGSGSSGSFNTAYIVISAGVAVFTGILVAVYLFIRRF